MSVRSTVRPFVCLSVCTCRALFLFYTLFFHFFFSLAGVWIARVCTNVMFDFHLASGDIVSIASVIDVLVAVFVASLTCANCFFGEAAREKEREREKKSSSQPNKLKTERERLLFERTKRSIELNFIARV